MHQDAFAVAATTVDIALEHVAAKLRGDDQPVRLGRIMPGAAEGDVMVKWQGDFLGYVL